MTIRELKKETKTSWKGKWKEIGKATLLFAFILILINTSASILTNKIVINPLLTTLNGDVYDYFFDSTSEFFFSVLVYAIYCVAIFFVGGLFCYGMVACMMDIKHGYPASFHTAFEKIRSRIKKVVSVTGRYFLKEILYTVIYFMVPIIAAIILSFFDVIFDVVGSYDLMESFSTIATIVLMICSVIYIYKSISLLLEMMISNFILYDYPLVEAKTILDKAKQIISKNKYTYLSLMFCTLWFLPMFLIAMVLFSNAIDFYIWLPSTGYAGIILNVISTAPTWFLVLKSILITFIEMPILIKLFALSGTFYRSFEPETLFDDDYNVQKEKRSHCFIALGLIAIYVATGIVTYHVWDVYITDVINDKKSTVAKENERKNLSYWSENTSINDTSHASIENADIENIKVEFVGYTEDNKFVMKVRNEDEKPAYIDSITTLYESDNAAKTDTAKGSSLIVNPNSELYVYNDETDFAYTDYHFHVNLMLDSLKARTFSDANTLEFITTHDEENLHLEVKNNSTEDILSYNITILYYKNEKIVGIDYNYTFYCDLYSGKSDFVNIALPKIEDTAIDFDDCVIQLNKYEKNDYTVKKAIDSLKLEEVFLDDNGDLLLKVKNESEGVLYINSVETIFRDENGKFVEKQECDEIGFIMKPQSETYFRTIKSNIDFTKYSNIDMAATLYETYSYDAADCDIAIKTIDNNENITVQLKNNTKKDFNRVDIRCIFFQDEKPVAFTYGVRNSKRFAAGKTITMTINYPNKDIDYDYYKVEITHVDNSSTL